MRYINTILNNFVIFYSSYPDAAKQVRSVERVVVVVDVDVDLLIDAKNSLPSLEKEDISPYRVIFIANGVNLFMRQLRIC